MRFSQELRHRAMRRATLRNLKTLALWAFLRLFSKATSPIHDAKAAATLSRSIFISIRTKNLAVAARRASTSKAWACSRFVHRPKTRLIECAAWFCL
jgi:hypothetical protein